MRVSIVIPAYNEARDLPACLESLARQTSAPFEVIVVDNNSSDDTALIAKHHDARVISEKNQGIACARTTGFDAARGDIIARTDADCEVATDWVEVIQRTFMTHPHVDALRGDMEFAELGQGNRLIRPLYYMLRRWHEGKFGGEPILYGANFALRRSSWQQVRSQARLLQDSLSEDIELSLLVRTHGTILSVPEMRITTKLIDFLQPLKLVRYNRSDRMIARRQKGRWRE